MQVPADKTRSFLGPALYYGLSGIRLLLAALVVSFAISALYELGQRFTDEPARATGAGARFDSLPVQTDNPRLAIRGRFDSDTEVTIEVNSRSFGPFPAIKGAPFVREVSLARQRNSITVRSEGIIVFFTTVLYVRQPLLEPAIHGLLELPSGDVLLVGHADASSLVALLRGGQHVASVITDSFGLFDLTAGAEVLKNPEQYSLSVARGEMAESQTVGLREALHDAAREPIARSVRVDLVPERPTIEFAATGPTHLAEFQKFLAGDMPPAALVERVFGSHVDGEDREQLVTSTPEGATTVRLLSSVYLPEGTIQVHGTEGYGAWPLLTRADTFVVTWDRERPTWFSPAPEQLEEKRAVWRGPLQHIEVGLPPGGRIGEQPPPGPAERPMEPEPPRTPTVRELVGNMRLPRVGAVSAHAVLLFLPFGWMLYALRTRPGFLRFDARPDSRACVGAGTLLIGAIALRYPVESLVAAGAPYLAQATYWEPVSFLILWLAFLACVPLLVRRLEEPDAQWLTVEFSGRARPKLWPLAVRAAAGILLGAALWLAPKADLVNWAGLYGLGGALEALMGFPGLAGAGAVLFVVLTLGGWALFLSYLFMWLAYLGLTRLGLPWGEWLGDDRLYLATVAACALIVLAALVPVRRLWPPQRLGAGVWFRFGWVALGLAVLYALASMEWATWAGAVIACWVFLWLCFYLAGGLGFPVGSSIRYGAYLLAALFCYPHQDVSASPWGVIPLLNDFSGVSKYLILVAVAVWLGDLWRNGERTAELDAWVGPALFAFFLIGSAGYVFYVPVPLILGYLLARYWLFRPVETGAPAGSLEERRAAVKELAELRWLSNMQRSVRRAQDKKLQKGEISLEQRDKALEPLRAKEEELRREGAAKGPAGERALTRGPHESAWGNAVTALQYGLPLALGPVALLIYRFAAQEWNAPHATPMFFLRVLTELCYWLFMAFFFGYFYRRLRGVSGLGKGFWLAIAIVVPYLCLRLLLVQSLGQMGGFFTWAGLVFAYCTLLGLLAFDFETLRLCGFSWQQLTAVHRTPTLSAFASFLLAALGPVLLAVQQGRATDMVNFALSFLGQLFPESGAGRARIPAGP